MKLWARRLLGRCPAFYDVGNLRYYCIGPWKPHEGAHLAKRRNGEGYFAWK